MKPKAEIRADSTARVVETIGKEMAEWQQTDYSMSLLPNFYPGERQRCHDGQLIVIDRADFTRSMWGGSPQFAADARKAQAFKQEKHRERAYCGICDAEREALATALMLDLFGITELDPILAQLPHLDALELLTVEDRDKKAIAEAFSGWLG
ncbi:hypothetical protein A8351_004392 [Escherichia coli]|nr:hypothetical protein [Escherichia coli]